MSDPIVRLQHIKAFLFDVDGTLVDSGNAHVFSLRAALTEMRLEMEVADQDILSVIGSPIESIYGELVNVPERRREFVDVFRRKMYFEGGLDLLRSFPKVSEALLRLKTAGRSLAITTNKRQEGTLAFLRQVDIRSQLFDCIMTADLVRRGKPSPDLILSTLDRLSARPDDAVLVGDTPDDFEAASSAGIMSIGVECGYGRNLKGACLVVPSVSSIPDLIYDLSE